MRDDTELHFNSIHEYGEYCLSLGDKRPAGAGVISEVERSHSWTGGMTYSQALKMALYGGNWIEGARELQSVDINEMVDRIAQVLEPTIVLAPAGGAVDIGEYLNNSPECFYGFEQQEQPRPIVRMGVNINLKSDTTLDQSINFGRAVLAVITALEQQGRSVELTVIHKSRSSGESKGFKMTLVLKQAGQAWDAASAAFALAHPAFSRRLGFRAIESDPNYWRLSKEGYGNGLGNEEGYDVFIPYNLESGRSNTPQGALDHVMEFVRTQAPELAR